MKDFKNDVIGQEKHRLQTTIFIGIGFIVLAVVLMIWGIWKDSQATTSLHDLIVNNSSENQKGYIDVIIEPYSFAYYTGESDYFYYVMDKDKYMYVVRMSDSDYQKIKANASEEKPMRIEGVTKVLPSDIKNIGIEVYNEELDPENPINVADFNNYFGEIYIDLSAMTNAWVIVVSMILSISGFIILLVGGIQKFRFTKNIKKLTQEERKKLDDELNDKDSFYYKSAHVYLTKNYIFNFASTFEAIPYKDIVWIYPFEVRNRGVKTNQVIKVVTKNGKTRSVASLTAFTKKSKDIFEEIYETICNKNEKMLKGYTKENQKKVKELIEKPKKS